MLINIRALLTPILVHCLFVKNLQLARTINNNPQIARAECARESEAPPSGVPTYRILFL